MGTQQNHLWELVAKKLACEASEQELAELQLLTSSDEELEYMLQVLERVWDQPPKRNTPEKELINKQFQKMMNKLRHGP